VVTNDLVYDKDNNNAPDQLLGINLYNYQTRPSKTLMFNSACTNRPTGAGGFLIGGGGSNDYNFNFFCGWNDDDVFYRAKKTGAIGATFQVASRQWANN